MTVDHVITNIRDAEVTPGSGKDVKDTNMLAGLASNSLSGKNSTTQYDTSSGAVKGPYGGMPSGK